MEKILKLVITGGPCAGKTTALSKIKNYLERKGYDVLISDETATPLIGANVIPGKTVDLILFQKLILDLQMSKEEALLEAAKNTLKRGSKKVAIIYDRGILDNRAYITHKEFKELADNKGLIIGDITKRYDLILHLVSLAKDKPEEYIKLKESNPARLESLEEAIEVENNTLKAWPNTSNKFVIGNEGTFEDKVIKMEKVIDSYLKKQKKELLAKAEKVPLKLNVRNHEKQKFLVNKKGRKYLVETYLDGSDMKVIDITNKSNCPIFLDDYRKNKPKVFSKAI